MGPVDDRLNEFDASGRLRENLTQLFSGFCPAVADVRCSRESFESQTLWCTEESLEGAHVRWFTLLQGGEKAAAIVIGHHDAEIWPRFRSGDDEAGDVVECSQIAQQRVGWAF